MASVDPTTPKDRRPITGSDRPRPSESQSLGPLNPDQQVSATFVVRHKPEAPPLPDHQYWASTRLGERKYLSPREYANTYGASQSDIDAVTAFAIAQGLTVLDTHAGRRTVAVAGTASRMNAAFGIRLNRYETPLPQRRSRAPATTRGTLTQPLAAAVSMHHGYDGPLHIPAELEGIVVAVVGLDNRAVGDCGGSSGDPAGAKSLSVTTAAGLYNFPNSGAADQVIGVIAPSDPVGTTNQRLSGYLTSDITSNYFPNLSNAAYRTAPASLNDVNLTVGTNTYSNSTATVTAITSSTLGDRASGFAMEVTQDISTAATIAQGATVNVYFTEITEQGLLVCLNRILLPESEKQPTVVTCSFNFWGSDDSGQIGNASDSGSAAYQMSELFQALSLVGVGMFMISQDRGSDDGVNDGKAHVCYPGSDPWVTSVGGTVIGTVNTGPPVTFTEVVWSNADSLSPVGGFAGASGGGPSQNFPVPFYQSNAGITSVTDSNGHDTTNKRSIPDVAAMVSYSGSGAHDWFFINGLKYNFTGTSCACPLLAGLYAVLRSAFGVPLGFLNPTLYQIAGTVCNDIASGNNDPADSSKPPFYNAGTGWDPCTGWGSLDGTKLLNGIAAAMYNQTFYFQVEKSSYGLDEVTAAKSATNTPPDSSLYSPAFWLVLEGFTPVAAQGIAAPTVSGVFSTLAGVTITVGAAQPELPSQPSTPQRILYPCSVDFAASTMSSVASGGIFPAPGASAFSLPLTALISIGGQLLAAAAVFELDAGADPYFSNFNAAGSNAFYLSNDLRVFTVTPGIDNAPILGVPLLPADTTKYDSGAAYNYIQALLATVTASHSDATGSDVFASFPDQTSALIGDSSVTPSSIDPAHPTGTRLSNCNFAVARVRLDGPPNTSSTKNVRVFFRMFATQTSDTDYNTDWTYPSNTSGGLPTSPLLGTGDPPVTIPFFATGNYEANADHPVNVDYTAPSANNLPIQIGPSGKTWAYFGCYLNVYPTANTINGKSVQSMLPGTHHCLVAQIAFDDAPIVNANGTTESPSNCDKLAQRNLEITFSDNPGPPATHRIPQTFDTRPSRAIGTATGDLTDYPDELMIDWGNTPTGAVAHIYWPQVTASSVLDLAHRIYSTHQLTAADSNTLRCKVPRGFTYVPIPPSGGENYAGLLTVDLPPGVAAGQIFTITIRRVATRQALVLQRAAIGRDSQTLLTEAIDRAAVGGGKKTVNWRYVTGSFAVRIPVTIAKVMLPLEEDTLAIMKWRIGQLSPGNRWHPVLARYIGYLRGRVDGLGGNSVSIDPSPYGVPPSGARPRHEHLLEYTGKVMSVQYDRFGDFAGFILKTEAGHEHAFEARERAIEVLAREAWAARMVIRVVVRQHGPHCPVSISLLRTPRPLHLWSAADKN
jgi:Pro-kumamolisin, activation domain